MPALEFVPLLSFNLLQLAEIFNRCFEGYVLPVHVTPEMLAARIRRDSASWTRSFVAVHDGREVGICLVAPRYDILRLSGMGVAAEARGTGVGRAMLTRFLEEGDRDGYLDYVLEVFEQNVAALRLYESVGFKVREGLYGFTRKPLEPDYGATLRDISLMMYFYAVREASEDLPLIHMPEQAATLTLPVRCCCVTSNSLACYAPPAEGQPIVLQGLYTYCHSRRLGRATALLRAIQAAHPGSDWFIPQVVPDSKMGAFFRSLGFQQMELNQFEMHLTRRGKA